MKRDNLKYNKFINNYQMDVSKSIDEIFKNQKDKIIRLAESIKNIKRNKGKIIIFGNGGSAATASHFSVDLTKNAKIKSLNFCSRDLPNIDLGGQSLYLYFNLFFFDHCKKLYSYLFNFFGNLQKGKDPRDN